MHKLTWAEVDLSAIRDNVRAIRERVGPDVRIMPAVKANGYGHGAVPVSWACMEGGADALGVATVDEGIQLRQAGLESPILILGCSPAAAAGEIVESGLASTVCDLAFARALSAAARMQQKTASVHIKVDTGMGRIGVMPEETAGFVLHVSTLAGLRVDGVFTHFASSDEADPSFTLSQIEIFKTVVEDLKSRGLRIPLAHASNSGGILAFPNADFDLVRPGIMVYGHYPSANVVRSVRVREALTLKTHIVFLKSAAEGSTVSYGRTHTLTRPSKVATLPIGYADGYSRLLSGTGEAVVRGIRVPVIGRVCMDQTLIDVTDVPGVQVEDEVILYGGGYDDLSPTHIAEKMGTISYEVLCAIGQRVPRVYSGG